MFPWFYAAALSGFGNVPGIWLTVLFNSCPELMSNLSLLMKFPHTTVDQLQIMRRSPRARENILCKYELCRLSWIAWKNKSYTSAEGKHKS